MLGRGRELPIIVVWDTRFPDTNASCNGPKSVRLRLVAKLFAVHHLSSLVGKMDPQRDSNRNDRYDAHSNDNRYFRTF